MFSEPYIHYTITEQRGRYFFFFKKMSIKGNVACEISTLLIPFVGIKIQFVSSISSHLLLRNEKMYYTALCVYCSLIRKKISYDNFYLVRGSRIPLQASFARIRSEVCKNINLTFLTNQTQKTH